MRMPRVMCMYMYMYKKITHKTTLCHTMAPINVRFTSDHIAMMRSALFVATHCTNGH